MAQEKMNGKFIFVVFVTCFAGVLTANIQINSGVPNLLVALGSKQVLDCFVESDKAFIHPVLQWTYQQGDNVTISPPTVSNSTFHLILTIDAFSDKNTGSYNCTYTEDDPMERNKTTIYLSYVQENKTDGEYFFGNTSVTLMCSIELQDGTTVTFVEWRKYSANISQLADVARFQGYSNGTLIINNPTRKDAGPYVARYSVPGKFGPYYDCEVIYKGSPLVLDMDKSKNVVEGDHFDMNCLVKGYPQPSVVWLKDKKAILKDGDRINMITYDGIENAHLTIKSVRLSDEGTYTCEASDSQGQKSSKSIIVRIKDRLDWLWPIIGIICEAIVLGIVIFICGKVKKVDNGEPPTERPGKEGNRSGAIKRTS